ncbi:hypothetical protein AVEN_168261-1, partial [Araneus ventricosus]
MGKVKFQPKFAATKKVISLTDKRIQQKDRVIKKKKKDDEPKIKEV